VPVGDDQKQHLELTRDIAQKFNNDFKVDLFPLPEPMILGAATRVMSLRDGSSKMSKSDPSEYSRINLTDGPDDIALKIRRAKTDPEPLPRDAAGLAGRPEADNLLGIYAALARKSRDEALTAVGGMQFSQFKQELTDLAVSVLGPIGQEMQRLVKDPGYIDGVLRKGGERARAISRPIIQEVYERVGFVQP
jgi:tryptophanyl-tRNA synthetase